MIVDVESKGKGGRLLRSSRVNQSGFTLIETMVAVTLLTIGLLAMAGLTAGIIQRNTFSRQASVAATLAQTKLEDVRRAGYAAAALGTATENYNSGGPMLGYEAFKRVTTVLDNTTTPSSGLPAGMKKVEVTVFWAADARSVGMQTILTQ